MNRSWSPSSVHPALNNTCSCCGAAIRSVWTELDCHPASFDRVRATRAALVDEPAVVEGDGPDAGVLEGVRTVDPGFLEELGGDLHPIDEKV